MPSPRSVIAFSPSMNTGAAGASPVPGRLMPMSACLLSPGPLTMQPITATFIVLDARIPRLPHRHLRAQVVVDLLGQFLERRAGGAAAARAGGDAGVEAAQAERLQDLERDHHLLRARLAGLRRQRHADRVADAFLQQQRQRGGGGHRALGAHAGFGEPEVQRVVAARAPARGTRVIRSCTPLTLQLMMIWSASRPSSRAHRPSRCADCTSAWYITCLASHGSARLAFSSISAASSSWSRLPQLTPMRTGLSCAQRRLDHLRELAVALVALADVAGVDAVLRQRLRASPESRSAGGGRCSGSRRSAARRCPCGRAARGCAAPPAPPRAC